MNKIPPHAAPIREPFEFMHSWCGRDCPYHSTIFAEWDSKTSRLIPFKVDNTTELGLAFGAKKDGELSAAKEEVISLLNRSEKLQRILRNTLQGREI